jgi:hypothetical protein
MASIAINRLILGKMRSILEIGACLLMAIIAGDSFMNRAFQYPIIGEHRSAIRSLQTMVYMAGQTKFVIVRVSLLPGNLRLDYQGKTGK